MITVEPDVIDPNGYANVSHDDAGPLTITITNGAGDSMQIVVQAGDTVKWYPPEGWTEATFSAEGHDEVKRFISSTP